MKIWLLSDLHLNYNNYKGFKVQLPKSHPDYDVVVLAGDIHESPLESLRWAEDTFEKDVVVVSGNHEYYGHDLIKDDDMVMDYFLSDHVHYLNSYNPWVLIDGVKFVGSTLWTNFELDGNVEAAMKAAAFGMADYQCITMGGKPLTPIDILNQHNRDIGAIVGELDANMHENNISPEIIPYKSVVVTHHVPHPLFLDRRFLGSSLNPSFVSDQSHVINIYRPNLWLFGHTHTSFDSWIGDTHFVCNPHGYQSENAGNFDPSLIVEL